MSFPYNLGEILKKENFVMMLAREGHKRTIAINLF